MNRFNDRNNMTRMISMRVPDNVLNLLNNFNVIDIYTQNNNQPLEDVIVTVNDEDLDRMERIQVLEDTEIECTICLNNINTHDEMVKLSCNHSYHSNCIMTYLKNYNHKCPVCRYEIGTPKYNISDY